MCQELNTSQEKDIYCKNELNVALKNHQNYMDFYELQK